MKKPRPAAPGEFRQNSAVNPALPKPRRMASDDFDASAKDAGKCHRVPRFMARKLPNDWAFSKDKSTAINFHDSRYVVVF